MLSVAANSLTSPSARMGCLVISASTAIGLDAANNGGEDQDRVVREVASVLSACSGSPDFVLRTSSNSSPGANPKSETAFEMTSAIFVSLEKANSARFPSQLKTSASSFW